jgi:galactose mutarotase-like enzyme
VNVEKVPTFRIAESGTAIEMDFHGFDHIALWTRPGAPFLCLEAWTGYSDPEGFAGDLFEKPSMRVLRAGERARHSATWRFYSRAANGANGPASASALARAN